MAYTDIDDPTLYFSSTIWTGNATDDRAIVIDGTGMQPDFIWIKSRNDGDNHRLVNSVSGATKHIESDNTSAEQTSGNVKTFTSAGVTLSTNGAVNENNELYVSWAWKAGTSFTNDASSTSVGSIDSTGSVNTDAGFSIIKWTGNDANATVAHGLGAVPGMFIVKNLSNATTGWYVYHQSLGNTKHILLDTAAALVDDINWNDTSPTSTVINLGGQTGSNGPSNSMLVYCFAEKQGYSKFGSYTGNGNADGTFVYTGFKPAMVICKKSNASGTNWGIIDNKRAKSFNQISAMLNPNSTGSEGANNNCDFVSNGFKWRTNDGNSNASGDSYIYMAFAEQPFVTSTGVPATAR